MPLDEPAPRIGLAMNRPLFTPAEKIRIEVDALDDEAAETSLDALFAITHVDKARLMQSIRRMLQSRSQASLEELIEAEPLQQGLAELIAYLSLAADDADAVIDDGQRRVTISWVDGVGVTRRAFMPVVIFKRTAPIVEAIS